MNIGDQTRGLSKECHYDCFKNILFGTRILILYYFSWVSECVECTFSCSDSWTTWGSHWVVMIYPFFSWWFLGHCHTWLQICSFLVGLPVRLILRSWIIETASENIEGPAPQICPLGHKLEFKTTERVSYTERDRFLCPDGLVGWSPSASSSD